MRKNQCLTKVITNGEFWSIIEVSSPAQYLCWLTAKYHAIPYCIQPQPLNPDGFGFGVAVGEEGVADGVEVLYFNIE